MFDASRPNCHPYGSRDYQVQDVGVPNVWGMIGHLMYSVLSHSSLLTSRTALSLCG